MHSQFRIHPSLFTTSTTATARPSRSAPRPATGLKHRAFHAIPIDESFSSSVTSASAGGDLADSASDRASSRSSHHEQQHSKDAPKVQGPRTARKVVLGVPIGNPPTIPPTVLTALEKLYEVYVEHPEQPAPISFSTTDFDCLLRTIEACIGSPSSFLSPEDAHLPYSWPRRLRSDGFGGWFLERVRWDFDGSSLVLRMPTEIHFDTTNDISEHIIKQFQRALLSGVCNVWWEDEDASSEEGSTSTGSDDGSGPDSGSGSAQGEAEEVRDLYPGLIVEVGWSHHTPLDQAAKYIRHGNGLVRAVLLVNAKYVWPKDQPTTPTLPQITLNALRHDVTQHGSLGPVDHFMRDVLSADVPVTLQCSKFRRISRKHYASMRYTGPNPKKRSRVTDDHRAWEEDERERERANKRTMGLGDGSVGLEDE
ncbi:Uu.00g050220.m01.CDS01 [Anthostomella pinea]|uniref:Uu.00g050220.m01.CDS01 n=1 Tax=Anthostomella pinea TaxID=933095 RepID=A0AAI8VTF9_9PEZI|nr:Uu.00g050220.m01.CDS01 [Anthostomella pinea]